MTRKDSDKFPHLTSKTFLADKIALLPHACTFLARTREHGEVHGKAQSPTVDDNAIKYQWISCQRLPKCCVRVASILFNSYHSGHADMQTRYFFTGDFLGIGSQCFTCLDAAQSPGPAESIIIYSSSILRIRLLRTSLPGPEPGRRQPGLELQGFQIH
jgi:hypothetical protein